MYDEDEETPEEKRAEEVPYAQYQTNKSLLVYSRDDTGHDLTVEEQLFVRSYIVDRNPIAALKRLDYAGENFRLKRIAERFLSNPEVTGAIDTLAKKMMEKLNVTAERVNKHLADMAFFDPRTIMVWDNGTLQMLDSRLWPDEAIAAVSALKMTKDAGVEIKFADKLKATEILGKQLNLLADPDELARKAAAEAAAEQVVDKMSLIFDRLAKKSDDQPSLQ